MKSLGFDFNGWEDLTRAIGALIAIVAFAGSAWTLWERRQHDPWLRLLGQAQGRLRDAGLDVPPTTPPRGLAALLQQHFAGHAPNPQLRAWLLDLEAQRYAGANSRSTPGKPHAGVARLRRVFKQLAWPRP
ncbi:MAG: transglutaminase [Rhodoferax sp.]|nr:transglutaminase [Rhodoferax sp.]